MESIIGQKIGQYTIVGFLGQGAVATVYKAKDATGSEVALKLLREGPGVSRMTIERFKKEAQASKILRKHPHAITVYETGVQGDIHYIAMECVGDGRTLKDILGERKLSTKESVEIAAQIASVLEYAHGKGMIHRDIKPGNIMINEFGQAVLSDFGLVKSKDDLIATYTATGAIVGTPIYMSPEQIRGENATAQYDIYSLGIVLYEMLAHRTPFQAKDGESIPHLVRKIADGSLPSPRKFNRSISKRLEAIVLKATEHSPRDRYRSMSDFLKDLRNLQEGKVVVARKPSVFEYFERNVRKHRIIAFVAAGAMLVMSFLVYSFRSELRKQKLESLMIKIAGINQGRRTAGRELVIPTIALLNPGDELFMKGDYQQALALYKDIAEHYDQEETRNAATYKAGLCYEKLGDTSHAIVSFSEIRKKNRNSDLAKLATVEIGVCLLQNKKLEDAVRELKDIENAELRAEIREKLAYFYQSLGDARRSEKNYTEAVEAYCNLIRIADSIPMGRYSATGRLSLARSFLEQRRFDEAKSELEKLVESYPNQRWHAAWALLDLGNLHLTSHDAKKASNIYRKLLLKYPDQVWQSRLAKLMLGEIIPAEFEPEIPSFHKDIWNDAYYALGLRCLVQQETGKAVEFFKQSLKLSDGSEWPAVLVEQQLEILQKNQ